MHIVLQKTACPINKQELAKIICDTSYLGWLVNYAQLSNIVAVEYGVNYDEMWRDRKSVV